MATNKRTYPNSNFAWYNDDNRLAILCEDITASSGERTKETYDSYQGDDVSAGIRITYKSKYGTIDRLFKGIFDIIRVAEIIKNKKNIKNDL